MLKTIGGIGDIATHTYAYTLKRAARKSHFKGICV